MKSHANLCQTQVKELKIEIKNKLYIKNITFETFKTMNAYFSKKKTIIFWSLNIMS